MEPKPLTAKQRAFVGIDAGRFWSRVDRSGGACWPWTAARDGDGYGRMRLPTGRTALAHRVSHWLATGESPEAVCHHCDNPSCCKPTHLFAGTRADNNHDMCRKGRHGYTGKKGSDHHAAKLTDADVLAIRLAYGAGATTQYDLAARYGVCQRTIAKVVRRIGWSHV